MSKGLSFCIARQQGVALLTILIMVVLATILAMSILKHQQANLDETKLMLRQDQALMYAQSAEYFLSELLIQDAKDNQLDNLNESWAKPMPIFPVEDGFVSGRVIDENSRFNLNTLLNERGEKNEAAILFFQNMLKRLELDPEMVEAIIDWQDNDQETVGAMGAENNYYQGLEQGYLSPNQMFSSVEQLQMVRGFAGEAYQKLKPYITVLPTRNSKMNINTVDGFVLTCLNDQLNQMMVDDVVLRMRNNMETFDNFAAIWDVSPFSNVEQEQQSVFSSLFDTKSAFFMAEITVNLSERERSMRSWLYRQGSTVQSYQRSWNTLTKPALLQQ